MATRQNTNRNTTAARGRGSTTGQAAKRASVTGATAKGGDYPQWGKQHTKALEKIQSGLSTLQPFMQGGGNTRSGGQGGGSATM